MLPVILTVMMSRHITNILGNITKYTKKNLQNVTLQLLI